MKTITRQILGRVGWAVLALASSVLSGYGQAASPSAKEIQKTIAEATAQPHRAKLIVESPMPVADQEVFASDKYLFKASDRLQRGRPEVKTIRAEGVLPELADGVPAGPEGKVVKVDNDPRSGD